MRKFAHIISCFLLIIGLVSSASAATYIVTKTADTSDGACDADCSLREAVAAANATAESDAIEFSALFNAAQTITLSGTDLIIANNGSLTINGPGADKLTVSGNNASRIFTNNTGAVTTINRLRVTGGTGTSTIQSGRGGGVYNNGGNLTLNFLIITGNTTANGGGVNNAGTATLTINNSAIFGNSATGSGGGLQNFSGNTTNIYNTSVYGNTCNSTSTGGGGIQANGTVNIVNSTFSGNNSVGGSGGAIYFNGTALNITNATVSANTSTNGGGGINKAGSNPINIRNSIIAGNNGTTGSPDVTAAVNSLGSNVIGVTGTSTGWIASDFQNVSPNLAPFGFYGGFGGTYALLSGSPALDGGQNCVADLSCATNNPPVAVATDQRGAARPFNTTVDIGAFEANSNYVAVLPGASLNQPYNFTLAGGFSGFTFLLNSGNFGGITLTSTANSAILSGTSNQAGIYNAAIQITNNTNSAIVNYSLTVAGTSVNARISGQVLSPDLTPIRNAFVTIRNTNGVVASARTNSFGNFTLMNVASGQSYTLEAIAKQYSFSPQTLNVNGDVTGVTITATSGNLSEMK